LGVVLICVLAAALIAACAFASRSWFLPVALSLQALVVLGWLITPTLGVMGVVFALVWALIIWFRNEFRRRLAAGTLPEPGPPAGGSV
jgi:heme/copper-type cytochrome/quinol oxidase subunit 2